jgi:hypothetical protein
MLWGRLPNKSIDLPVSIRLNLDLGCSTSQSEYISI